MTFGIRCCLPALMVMAAAPLTAQRPVLGEWMVPKVKAREVKVKRLVVLPSQFTLTKATMKGTQSLEDENLKFSPIIDRALAKALQNAGVVVSEATPTQELLANNAGLRSALGQVQQDFNSTSSIMFKKPKDVRKGRFKLSDESLTGLRLKEAAQSEAILFVRGSGGRQTKSKAFASGGGLIGAMLAGRLNLNIILTFVDALSGEVLFMEGFLVGVKDENTEERLVIDLGKKLKDDRKKLFGAS